MPSVSIGTTSKNVNSTSRVFSGGASLSCKLKESCSMQTPVFIVKGLSKGTFYNYASFEGRYYWVDDIVYLTNDIQEVHCHLDPLATFQDAIKHTTAYVKYGDVGHWNKEIDDFRMNPEVQPAVSITANSMSFLGWNSSEGGDHGGTVIVTTSACNSDRWGVINWAMSPTGFYNMLWDLGDMLTGSSATFVGDVGKDLANVFGKIGGVGSWKDNILRAIYLPIPISEYSGTTEDVVVGGITCTGHQGIIQPYSNVIYDSDTVTIPWSSESGTYPFLKNPRWASLQLQTPSGFQDIDTTYIKDQASFGIYSSVDKSTGEWSLVVRETNIGSGLILASASGTFGIDITGTIGPENSSFNAFMHKTAELTAKVYSMGGTSVIGSAGNAVGEAGIARGSESMFNAGVKMSNLGQKTSNFLNQSGISSGIAGAFAQAGISAGNASGQIGGGRTSFFLGGGSSFNGKLVLKAVQLMPKDLNQYTAYCDKYGYPVNAYLTLSSVSGYCECVGASVQGASGATESNLSTINSYLNGGIYIEA